MRALFTAFPVFLAIVLHSNTGWADEILKQNELPQNAGAEPEIKGAFNQAAIYSGYRFVTPVGNGGAAAPYQRLKSGVVGGGSAGTVGSDLKISADGQFLHSDDYNAELILDYSGLYRLKLDSTALWHNLDRFQVSSTPTVAASEQESGGAYGTRTVISRAANRIKLGNNPVHLNLNYWQLTREGTEQLRFSDHNFDANRNTVITSSVPVNSVTREGTFGLDAHAGLANIAYSFMIRDFSNNAADSRDFLMARDAVIAGFQAHDTVNDSRVTTHTFKLYSDLSGGLTGSALYALTIRETSTDRGDARPSGNPADTIHSAAGDLTYTPIKELTLALKYRRLEIDRESPATIYSPFSIIPPSPSATYTVTPGTLLVRPSSSSVKDTVVLSASYRPVPKATYRLEYRAELESRDNLPDLQAPANPGSLRSDSRQTHTGKASFIWKPLNAVKFNANYSYAASDNPAYPSSFSGRQSGQAMLSYTSRGRWGATASYLAKFDSGESYSLQTKLPRESISTSVNSTLWFSPFNRITVNTGYTFMQSEIDQTNLFSGFTPADRILTASNYRSAAHVYYIDTVLAATQTIDLSVALQQTFSNIAFSASDNSQIPALSSVGIGDTSRLVSTDTAVTSRADWRLNRYFGCSLGYSYRVRESGQPLFDGSAHETLLALTGRW